MIRPFLDALAATALCGFVFLLYVARDAAHWCAWQREQIGWRGWVGQYHYMCTKLHKPAPSLTELTSEWLNDR